MRGLISKRIKVLFARKANSESMVVLVPRTTLQAWVLGRASIAGSRIQSTGIPASARADSRNPSKIASATSAGKSDGSLERTAKIQSGWKKMM